MERVTTKKDWNMKLKLYLIKMPPFGYDSGEFFTINKWYDGDLTPIIYNPTTLEEKRGYVVICDDGYTRKVDIEYFITQEEFRENQLKELGI
jgi:hypothetical protein